MRTAVNPVTRLVSGTSFIAQIAIGMICGGVLALVAPELAGSVALLG